MGPDHKSTHACRKESLKSETGIGVREGGNKRKLDGELYFYSLFRFKTESPLDRHVIYSRFCLDSMKPPT